MKRKEALRRIRVSAQDRTLVFTEHAYEKMDKLGETEGSVSRAVQGAKSLVAQEDGSWRVFGGGLTCILMIRGDVVVVTLFV